VSSFLNLKATVQLLKRCKPTDLIIVCSGTFEECAYEDVLGAGALCAALGRRFANDETDSTLLARLAWKHHGAALRVALAKSKNGRRLLRHPQLKGDVPFCAQRDLFDFAAEMDKDGWIRRMTK